MMIFADGEAALFTIHIDVTAAKILGGVLATVLLPSLGYAFRETLKLVRESLAERTALIREVAAALAVNGKTNELVIDGHEKVEKLLESIKDNPPRRRS